MHLYRFFLSPWSSLFLGWTFIASCTLCQSWQKGGEIVEKMWFLFKILHVWGRNTCLCKGEMCFILLGGMLTFFFLYTDLVTVFTYIVIIFDIYIYIYDVCLLHLFLHVLFLFSLYAHASCILYAIFYFCFTLRCLDEFCLKCFRNISCQNLLAINSFLANFSRVCVRIDFIVFNKWVWVEWFMTSLICSFICCSFVTDCQRVRLLGHMWFNIMNICQYFM